MLELPLVPTFFLSAWRKQQTNAPGSITPKKGQSVQDALREKTSQPNLLRCEQSGIPASVTKPTGTRVESSNSLGRTNVEDLSP